MLQKASRNESRNHFVIDELVINLRMISALINGGVASSEDDCLIFIIYGH